MPLIFILFGVHHQDSIGGESLKNIEQTLQLELNGLVAKDENIHAAALHVEAPRIGLSWGGAAGLADPKQGIRMTPQHPVRIASNTKTFVAAAILRLWEEDRLGLDDPITEYLPSDFIQLLQSDGYRTNEITVRHLLTHTSGIFDYINSEAYGDQVEADLHRQWTRIEQLQAAIDGGKPYGDPGDVYAYSDTGYILLGEIIEQITNLPMGAALRDLIGYEALGLNSTWHETFESRPSGLPDRAHQFEGSEDWYNWHPSFDLYGGGGLVSTVGDLARFMRGVFTGQVYRRSSTAEMMLTTVSAKTGGPDYFGERQYPGVYRMGVLVLVIRAEQVYSHGGYWGTLAAYVPNLDLAVGTTVTQSQANVLPSLLRRVMKLVEYAEK